MTTRALAIVAITLTLMAATSAPAVADVSLDFATDAPVVRSIRVGGDDGWAEINPAILVSSVPASARLHAQIEPRAEATASLQPHPSILIDGDAAFLDPASGVRGGSGTLDDPFIISGWAIVHTDAYGIRLRGTRTHVVIDEVAIEGRESAATRQRDCLPSTSCLGSQGIDLQDAQNVTIRRARIIFESFGIFVRSGSARITVEDIDLGRITTSPGTMISGVYILRSTDVVIRRVSAEGGILPVVAALSARVDIAGSHFDGGSVAVLDSSDVSVHDNVFDGTSLQGRYLVRNLHVENNEFRGVASGVFVDAPGVTTSEGLVLCGNTFIGSAEGVSLSFATSPRIAGNRFLGTGVGAFIMNADDLVIDRNLFEGAGRRAINIAAEGARIQNNSFRDNARGAIIAGPGTDARFNWWNATDGPSGEGTGSGDPISPGPGVPYEPWLTAEPELDGGCSRAAPQQPPVIPIAANLSAKLAAHVRLKVDVIGQTVHVVRNEEILTGRELVLLP